VGLPSSPVFDAFSSRILRRYELRLSHWTVLYSFVEGMLVMEMLLEGGREILLLSSASRRGIKCSNSFSLSAAITSAGWIVFFPSSWAYSFELRRRSLLVYGGERKGVDVADGGLRSVYHQKPTCRTTSKIKLTWTRGNSQIQYSSYSAPTKHPCGLMCWAVEHPLLTSKSWFAAEIDPVALISATFLVKSQICRDDTSTLDPSRTWRPVGAGDSSSPFVTVERFDFLPGMVAVPDCAVGRLPEMWY
jgi:hypothetical protein